MKRIIAGLIMATFVFTVSCKKKEEKPETPETPTENISVVKFNFPSEPGTYWLYEINKINIDREILTEAIQRDCVAIIGDTIVDGEEYTALYYEYYPYESKTLLIRDNGKALVHENGNAMCFYRDYESQTSTDSLTVGGETDWQSTLYYDKLDDELYARYLRYDRIGEGSINSCDDKSVTLKNVWELGVGQKRSEFFYIAAFQSECTMFERVLINFYQPE